MTVEPTEKAKRQLKKLPKHIQAKVGKVFLQLAENPHHPALYSRKMAGLPYFEARIDYHYRLIYQVVEDTIYVLAVGMHDTGLGKK